MSTETTTIYDDEDNEIEVEFDYTPPCPCSRFEYGAPMEPDHPAEFDFNNAKDEDGNEIEITDEQQEQALEQIINQE
jgi:hypothetical protein